MRWKERKIIHSQCTTTVAVYCVSATNVRAQKSDKSGIYFFRAIWKRKKEDKNGIGSLSLSITHRGLYAYAHSIFLYIDRLVFRARQPHTHRLQFAAFLIVLYTVLDIRFDCLSMNTLIQANGQITTNKTPSISFAFASFWNGFLDFYFLSKFSLRMLCDSLRSVDLCAGKLFSFDFISTVSIKVAWFKHLIIMHKEEDCIFSLSTLWMHVKWNVSSWKGYSEPVLFVMACSKPSKQR